MTRGTAAPGATDRPRVRTTLEDRVSRVTLDRPEAGNAVDARLAGDLRAALLTTPDEARAVLLDATGPRFCVGGDVGQVGAAPDLAAFVERRPADVPDS